MMMMNVLLFLVNTELFNAFHVNYELLATDFSKYKEVFGAASMFATCDFTHRLSAASRNHFTIGQ